MPNVSIQSMFLAGGKSRRMHLPYPKYLLPIGNYTLIKEPLENCRKAGIKQFAVVVPADDQLIRKRLDPSIRIIEQSRPLGNAHALSVALGQLTIDSKYLLVGHTDSTSGIHFFTIRKFIHQFSQQSTPFGLTLFSSMHKHT